MATTSILQAWNIVAVTAMHKKVDAMVANNYRPVSLIGALPKLYMSCLNNQIMMEAELGEWRESTQAGFRKRHYREDLIVTVDYLIDRAVGTKQPH